MDDSQPMDGLEKFPLARRGFMMTSLISGLTLATTRVEAQAIHTDDKGLVDGEVKIPVADGEMPGYFARPAGNGPFPIIVVNEEVFGLHEYIKDVCRRFAKLGAMAVAVEVYARIADMSKITDGAAINAVVAKEPDASLMSDTDSLVKWAEANHGDAKRIGVIGFCRGGRTTWLYAIHNPAVKPAVVFYGQVNTPKTDIQPHPPIDLASGLKAPLLGMYAGLDKSISMDDVNKTADEGRKAGKAVEIKVFPDAMHGFHADYRPSYNEKDAKEGWDMALAWFRKYGVLPKA